MIESLERVRAYFSRMSLEDWQTRQADARALWAVRVLDALAGRSDGRSWRTTHNGQSCECMFPGHVARSGPTPDAARIAAAEALVEEDPSLGEGL